MRMLVALAIFDFQSVSRCGYALFFVISARFLRMLSSKLRSSFGSCKSARGLFEFIESSNALDMRVSLLRSELKSLEVACFLIC